MKLKKWELSLAVGLVLSLVLGLTALARDTHLNDKLVRLHVLAASDSREDQALKLAVRDRVLAETGRLLEDCRDAAEAQIRLEAGLTAIEEAGRNEVLRQGFDYAVRASLEKTGFPTRDYGTFALPAGQYTALRVLIGPAKGQNWWCVVFPPLCAAATSAEVSDAAYAAGLNGDDVGIMLEGREGYVLRFKLLEWLAFWRK